jgi:hypothetical protein
VGTPEEPIDGTGPAAPAEGLDLKREFKAGAEKAAGKAGEKPAATSTKVRATEPARGGAISTSARVASRLLGADGIAGELVDGAVRAGEQTAQSTTSPRHAALEPAPKGTRFFVFVSSFGGAP